MTDAAVWPAEGAEGAEGKANEDKATGPPLMFLAFAAGCVVLAVLVLGIDTLLAHVFGYFLASIMTIIAVGFFRRTDLTRRLSPGYRPQAIVGRIIPVLLVVAFVVSGLHVWAIATELAS